MDYLDFELSISPGRGRIYPVSVVRSPGGEATASMRFPFDSLALDNHLQALQIALLRSGGAAPARRALAVPNEQPVQEFGRALFDSLLGGDIRSCFDVSRREAASRGMGLRIKLRIDAPELAALPWEYLYDPRQAEYLCFSRRTPLVRYLDVALPSHPLGVDPPLRILGMIASPNDLDPLDGQRESQRLAESLKGLEQQGLVEMHWVAGQTWRELQSEMRGGPWHVFHFIGHGGFDKTADEGLIALVNDDGGTYRLRAQLLGRLLNDHDTLRLVVLNACEGGQTSKLDVFSSTAATLVRRGIPSVLAMQYEISDTAAIEFTRGFYGAVSDGLPVDAAVAEARSAVSYAIEGTLEWGTPVLYMRSPDGKIFDLAAAPARPAPTPPPVRTVAPVEAPAASQSPLPLAVTEATSPVTRELPTPGGSRAKSPPTGLPGPTAVEDQSPPPTSRGRTSRAWLPVAIVAGLVVIAGVVFGASHSLLQASTATAIPPPTGAPVAAARVPAPADASKVASNPADVPTGWTQLPIPAPATYVQTNIPGSSLAADGRDLIWTRLTNGGLGHLIVSPPLADRFQVTVIGHQTTRDTVAFWGAIFRFADNQSYYFAQVSETTNTLTLVKRVNGNQSQLAAKNLTGFPVNPDSARLSVRVDQAQFTIFYNSQQALATMDADLAGGTAGMWTTIAPATFAQTTFRFLAFQVWVPPTQP